MRFILCIVLIAVLGFVAELILPWWSIVIVAFAVALLIAEKPGRGFLVGFLGVGICWLCVALYHDIPNEHILSARMAKVFMLPNYATFTCVTILVGGLAGGLAAWSGALLKPKSI